MPYHTVSYPDLLGSSLDPPIWGECEKIIFRWLSCRFIIFYTLFFLLIISLLSVKFTSQHSPTLTFQIGLQVFWSFQEVNLLPMESRKVLVSSPGYRFFLCTGPRVEAAKKIQQQQFLAHRFGSLLSLLCDSFTALRNSKKKKTSESRVPCAHGSS